MLKKKINIIAEVGVNHNGNFATAKKLINVAKKSGADFVKFQIFNVDQYVTKNAPQAKYQIKNLKKKTNQFDMIKKVQLKESEFSKLVLFCKKKKIKFLASCFDIKSLKFYEKFRPKYYKIPSGEITNLPLLTAIGKKKKNILLSTGMSTFKEIQDALNILVKNGTKKKNIVILQCTTDYPCKVSDVNLHVLPELLKKFQCRVGFSDHTSNIYTAAAAVALGAEVVEKHLTLNRNLPGPDHLASLNASQFKNFVNIIRDTHKSMGSNKKIPTKNEKKNIIVARKSLVAIKKINKGEKFTLSNIGVKRPNRGISPMKIDKILGKKSNKKYLPDTFIKIK